MQENFFPTHILGIGDMTPQDIDDLLKRAERYATLNRDGKKSSALLKGKTVILAFFETSTRTRVSFELAAKRMGADVVVMSMKTSSLKKGETLIDTAETLNAMLADFLVVRHQHSGAVKLLARKVSAHVLNAGDGAHEHPTQALLDALTIKRHKGSFEGLKVAIAGDILHSRVARSNVNLLIKMGAEVCVIAPPTLMPTDIEQLGVKATYDMKEGLKNCDVVMMLRLQTERMQQSFIPSLREYFYLYGLDEEKLSYAKKDALVMHPGPMNRGVEIASQVADDIDRSVIQEQVEMGVAVRMASFERVYDG